MLTTHLKPHVLATSCLNYKDNETMSDHFLFPLGRTTSLPFGKVKTCGIALVCVDG